MDFLKDIIGMLSTRKKFWLVPALVVLLLVGVLVVTAGSTALAPFIYTVF